MNYKVLLVAGVVYWAASMVSGQQPNGDRIFTSAQAEAGHVAYEKTCGRCHTLTLMGRQGKPDERPAVSSLSEADQKFIGNYGGRVPPLAGKVPSATGVQKPRGNLLPAFRKPSSRLRSPDSPTMRTLCE